MRITNCLLHWLGVGVCLLVSGSVAWAGLENADRPPNAVLRPQKLALVIGINRTHKSTHWVPLQYARRDARRMARALRKIGRFDRIIGRYRARNTTRDALLQTLRRLKDLVKSKDDTVVVYISAHGTVNRKGERYIITSDTTQHIENTALSVRAVRRLLRTYRSHRIALVLAACYTGTNRSKSVLVPGFKGRVKPLPWRGGRAIQIVSAASHAQPAFESKRFRADVYTHFFLDCFRRLSSKTIVKIHLCAARQTTPYVRKLNGEVQVPKVYAELGANRDFSLAGARAGQKVGFFRARWRRGKRWAFRILRRRQKGGSQLLTQATDDEVTALSPGSYQIVVVDRHGKVQRKETISIVPGRLVEVASDWVLDGFGGVVFSPKSGGGSLAGGGIGLHYRWFRLRLGAWGSAKEYTWSGTSTQLFVDVRFDVGLPLEWDGFSLYLGGYLGGGVLMKHVGHASAVMRFATVGQLGLTSAFRVWMHPRLGLTLQLDGGLALFQEETFRVAWEGSLLLGLSVRL